MDREAFKRKSEAFFRVRNLQTGTFVNTSLRIRLKWRAYDLSDTPGWFKVNLCDEDGSAVTTLISRQGAGSGIDEFMKDDPTSDRLDLTRIIQPGTYRLEVMAEGIGWEIMVQEDQNPRWRPFAADGKGS